MPIPYNTIRSQRDRIIARLRRGPATRIELEQQENIPDATARIHELRKAGFTIDTDFVPVVNAHGTYSNCARYTLRDGEDGQGVLFTEKPCAAN